MACCKFEAMKVLECKSNDSWGRLSSLYKEDTGKPSDDKNKGSYQK